ncbi:cytochrome c oxidase subunit 5B, mitochondrial-like [Stomoxys calcitrans]|uniref:cytochrome c oxidase subunit 5B, mitochondrial-like n=1 Tax=Stomoxys calcitrans TaxID=35570 RepID=UPI0027E23E0B|nr:cytochrome c oxidase subunit 5B, mitochondrial-like [Stomoxys calcitrans]
MALYFRKILLEIPALKRCISASQKLFKKLPDPLELCTGQQKKEILAFMEGNCDPYHMAVIKRGSGTKDNPTLIPSAFNGRIVGCICNDNRFVNYMWLEKDCPKRCECGHWFKLKEVKAFS